MAPREQRRTVHKLRRAVHKQAQQQGKQTVTLSGDWRETSRATAHYSDQRLSLATPPTASAAFSSA